MNSYKSCIILFNIFILIITVFIIGCECVLAPNSMIDGITVVDKYGNDTLFNSYLIISNPSVNKGLNGFIIEKTTGDTIESSNCIEWNCSDLGYSSIDEYYEENRLEYASLWIVFTKDGNIVADTSLNVKIKRVNVCDRKGCESESGPINILMYQK